MATPSKIMKPPIDSTTPDAPENPQTAVGGRPSTPCSASLDRVMQQARASEKFRNAPLWVDAEKWLPMGPHEVLATDGEGWFIACRQGSEWWLHELDEPCDSEVTHWMELPAIPEV